MDFLDWMDRLRSCDVKDVITDLRDFDYEWEPYDETELFKDSSSNGRISINITPVKKQLNESIHQFSMDTSMLEATLDDQLSMMHDQQDDVNACLTQIEVATKTLNKLCHRCQHYDSKTIVESLAKMQNIVETLKGILQSKDSSDCTDPSASTISSANNTVIDMTNDTKNTSRNENTKDCKEKDTKPIDIVSNSNTDKSPTKENGIKNSPVSPKKSDIRNSVTLDTKSINSQKSVRFNDKK